MCNSFKFFAILIILALATTDVLGFRSLKLPMQKRMGSITSQKIRMVEEPNVELVPVDKTNVESAAAVTGGVLGFALGGPLFAVVFAALSNYLSKKENESGEALRGVGKVVVETYNFLKRLNAKYNLTDKASNTVVSVIDSTAGDNETVDKIKESYSTAVNKLSELNKEYDLVSKGKEVVTAAATLSEVVIEKAVELNVKYDLVGSATKAAAGAVDQVKENINKA